MKYFGSAMEFVRQRDRALLDAFNRILSSGDKPSVNEACLRVAQSPSPRFWVSPERATIVVGAMLAGRPMPRMRQSKRDMFNEIFSRFNAMRAAAPGISIYDAVSVIINQPAPSFYLSARTVALFVYRAIRNRNV